MGKYNITYSCRHEGRIESFGKIANREKKAVLIVLCFTIALVFCSCNFINPILRNESNSKGSYMLSDRQKKILKQEGLPLDYEKLNDTQKSAIECIEDIFKYLDKTYPKEKFKYSGYVPYSTLEPEHLIVESQYGEVTVNRYVTTDSPDKPPTFKDDFKDVKAADIYATVVDDYLAKKYDTDKYLVDVSVSKYLDDTFDTKTITQNCNCCVYLYVDDSLGLKIFKDISKDLVDFMKNNTGDMLVEADIELINSSDFSMNISEEFDNGLSTDVIKKHIEYYRNDSEEKVYEVKGE
ncbi:hypothetical protein ACTQ2N_11345 [Ruminococcus sp. LCP21S3_E8]